MYIDDYHDIIQFIYKLFFLNENKHTSVYFSAQRSFFFGNRHEQHNRIYGNCRIIYYYICKKRCTVAYIILKNILFIFFRERWRERERERETSMCGCLSHALYWEPGLQPRHVSWLGIEQATLCFAVRLSIHWATSPRALYYFFDLFSFWTE